VALLSRFHSGDVDAERKLFERHRSELLERATSHRLMRYLRRHITAEDAVDEVFVRALSSGLFTDLQDNGRGSLGRALAKYLDYTLLDACRRHGAQMRGPNAKRDGCDSAVMDTLSTPDPTPTGLARFAELRDLCQKYLEPREWEVWRLSIIEGLDHASISRRLGISAAAVRGLLFRAKNKVARSISRDEMM
jgi:RNA polymerase sigma factor (sigma-70 family)